MLNPWFTYSLLFKMVFKFSHFCIFSVLLMYKPPTHFWIFQTKKSLNVNGSSIERTDWQRIQTAHLPSIYVLFIHWGIEPLMKWFWQTFLLLDIIDINLVLTLFSPNFMHPYEFHAFRFLCFLYLLIGLILWVLLLLPSYFLMKSGFPIFYN